MQGLKTKVSDKFLKYFQLVQREAARLQAVYFAGCIYEEGEECYETSVLKIATMTGWLIPSAKVDAFEMVWKNLTMHEIEAFPEWEIYSRFAEWKLKNGNLRVEFWDYTPFNQLPNRFGSIHLDGIQEDQVASLRRFCGLRPDQSFRDLGRKQIGPPL